MSRHVKSSRGIRYFGKDKDLFILSEVLKKMMIPSSLPSNHCKKKKIPPSAMDLSEKKKTPTLLSLDLLEKNKIPSLVMVCSEKKTIISLVPSNLS